MRVLWFTNTPAAGDELVGSSGSGGWLKSLDKALQKKVELHVAFYNRHYPNMFKVGKTTYYSLAPRDKKSLVLRKLAMSIGRNPDLGRYLEVIKKVKPDIIHIHGTEQSFVQLSKYTDVPIILSAQGILTVFCYKFFSGIAKKDLPFLSHYTKSYKNYCRQAEIERDSVKDIRYVMGRTDWDRRVFSVLAPKAKYFVGGEILREDFYNTSWEEPQRNDQKIIVHTTTGGMLFKGLETICQSLSILNNFGFDIEWRVAGIGEKSEIVRIVKKKLGKDYPQKGLILFGSLSEALLIEKMLEAHLFVYTSHQDNSPNSLCEATLLGMPCITTLAGGSGSILKDGETGIVIQDGDPWALSGAVLELARNKELARKYGAAARTEATTRHNCEHIVDDMLLAYGEIVKSNV